MLNNVLDFEESKIDGRLVPKRGINEQLDELNQTYAGFDSLLVRRKLQWRLINVRCTDGDWH
jgi:hypothetical protein